MKMESSDIDLEEMMLEEMREVINSVEENTVIYQEVGMQIMDYFESEERGVEAKVFRRKVLL